jgi:hypothetical protein
VLSSGTDDFEGIAVGVGGDTYPESLKYMNVDGERFSTSDELFVYRSAVPIIERMRRGT